MKKISVNQISAKIGPKTRFCHFVKFGLLVFLEIAYSDSFQQCIISSRVKTHKKNWGEKFGPKLGLKLGFLLFSQFWFIIFP